jgi:hypothetical protein
MPPLAPCWLHFITDDYPLRRILRIQAESPAAPVLRILEAGRSPEEEEKRVAIVNEVSFPFYDINSNSLHRPPKETSELPLLKLYLSPLLNVLYLISKILL